LIEVLVVIVILAAIGTIAWTALGKMFTSNSEVRSMARSERAARQAMLELSRELHSASSVEISRGKTERADGQLSADTLVYRYNGRPGDPFRPATVCTVRLAKPDDPANLAGLVKQVRSELGGEESTSNGLVGKAVGFEVRALAKAGRISRTPDDTTAVSITVWVEGMSRSRGPRSYSTAVNVPRLIWKGVSQQGENSDV
jgi:type II secretory pathway pseudopilin PulG